MTSKCALSFPFERTSPLAPSASLAEVRSGCPAAEIELASGDPAWLVARYDDVERVLADPRFSRAAAASPVSPHFAPFTQLYRGLLFIDGFEHQVARQVLAQALSPELVGRVRTRLQRVIDTTLDVMADALPPIDFLQVVDVGFGQRLLAELLGVEPDVLHTLRGHLVAAMSITEVWDGEITRRWSQLSTMVDELLRGKLADPGDDLLTAIAGIHHQRPVMNADQLVALVLSLVIPGVVDPIGSVTTGVMALLHHRDQYARLVEAPDLVPSGVEELLRFSAAIELDHPRVVTKSALLGGVALSAGTQVFTSITAANRDPFHFVNPDVLDVGRTPNRHLAFGHGPHRCPAMPFVRTFLTDFLTALVGRFRDLQLALPLEELRMYRRPNGSRRVCVEQLLVTWATPNGSREPPSPHPPHHRPPHP